MPKLSFAMPNSMESAKSLDDTDKDDDEVHRFQLGRKAAETLAPRFTFQELLDMLAKEHDQALATLRSEISSDSAPVKKFSAKVVTLPGNSIPSRSSRGSPAVVRDETLCISDEDVKRSNSKKSTITGQRRRVSFGAPSQPPHNESQEEEEKTCTEPEKPRSIEPGPPPARKTSVSFQSSGADAGDGSLAALVPMPTHAEDEEEQPAAAPRGRKSLDSMRSIEPGRLARIVREIKLFEEARATSESVVAIRGFLDHTNPSRAAMLFAIFWKLSIVVSACVPLIRMIEDERMENQTLDAFEFTFDLCFLVDLAVRLATCPRTISFIRSPYFILEVLAMLPLVLRITVGGSVPAQEGAMRLSLLILTPIIRLCKLMRFFSFHFNIFGEVVSMTKGALVFLLFWLLIIVLVSSSLLYMAEPRTNLATFQKCIWFSLVTMTTVGYGDVTPESTGGIIISMISMIVSFLFLAIPVGILGNAFTEVWSDRDRLVVAWKFEEMLDGMGMSYQEVPTLFRRYDLDQDGAIGLREFRLMNEEMQTGLDDKGLAKLFKTMDKDGNNSLDQKEFVEAFFPHAYSILYEKTKLRRLSSSN